MSELYLVTEFGCNSGVGNLYSPTTHVFSNREDALALFRLLAYDLRTVGREWLLYDNEDRVIQRGQEWSIHGVKCPRGVHIQCVPIKTMTEEERLEMIAKTIRNEEQIRCECGGLYHPNDEETHLKSIQHRIGSLRK